MEQTEEKSSDEESPLDTVVLTSDTSASGAVVEDNSNPIEEDTPQPVKRSSWTLVEREEFTSDLKEYRRRVTLMEALVDLRDGRNLSRRVINIWAYQRREARWAS